MTQAPPPESPRTPGYGEGNQGYGPSAGQPGSGYGAPAGQPGGYGAPAGQRGGYDAPRYGAPAGDPYNTPARREDTIGVVGLVIALIGVAALLVSFLAVDWFSAKISHFDFSDLHDAATSGSSGNPEVFKLYFNWLGWVMLAAVAVIAIVANLPTPASPALRVLGLLIGLAGVGLTFWSIKLPSVAYSDVIKEARLGFYLAAGGFLFAGIGAVIGPQRR